LVRLSGFDTFQLGKNLIQQQRVDFGKYLRHEQILIFAAGKPTITEVIIALRMDDDLRQGNVSV
jgi:hypothetical protein